MSDVDDLIRSARPLEGTVRLCLRGDLLAEYADLERRLGDAQHADARDSLAAGGQARVLAERMEELLRQIDDHTHPFTFRALPRHEFRRIQDQHPPREGNHIDATLGGNIETFPAPLIQACCLEPKMTDDQVGQLVDVLSDGQLMELFGCALGLNRSRVDLPKFEPASAILARLEPRSRLPVPGGSPGSDSSAGSLAGLPPTPMTTWVVWSSR